MCLSKWWTKVGDLSDAIRETNLHWPDKLFWCVYGHLDYDDIVLDTTFDRLFETKMKARFFISKPEAAQKGYLNQVARELSSDGPSSQSWVQSLSSLDEDDGNGNDHCSRSVRMFSILALQ